MIHTIKIYSCYLSNIPEKIINYQKKVFDLFNINLIQEYTTLDHDEYLDQKLKEDFDYIIFFDIDCIPLKLNIIEYIISQIADKKSIIGVEQSNQKNSNFIYAGPACFGISKDMILKLDNTSFKHTNILDVGGDFTLKTLEKGLNVKFFNIKSSLNKKWKCGDKKFGNGTVYDDWLYHQFEIGRYSKHPHLKILEYEFIKKCKEIINEYNSINNNQK